MAAAKNAAARIATKKRFGQHFLTDPEIIKGIIDFIAPAPADSIVEIGAGRGALTEHLLTSGARLIAIEIDRDLAPLLRKKYAAHGERFQLIEADVLTLHLPSLSANENNTAAPVRIVGNLPYNISTPLLLKLAQHTESQTGWLQDACVMVQKEVGARLAAAPATSDYGRLSVSMQRAFTIAKVLPVLPAAFAPPPQVDSIVLSLTPKQVEPVPPQFDKVVRLAFQHRRKTLHRALSSITIDWQACPIDSHRRPQTLTPQEFATLCNYVQQK